MNEPNKTANNTSAARIFDPSTIIECCDRIEKELKVWEMQNQSFRTEHEKATMERNEAQKLCNMAHQQASGLCDEVTKKGQTLESLYALIQSISPHLPNDQKQRASDALAQARQLNGQLTGFNPQYQGVLTPAAVFTPQQQYFQSLMAHNFQMNLCQDPQMNMANNPQVSLAQNPQMSMAQNPQINMGKNPQTNMAQNPQMNMGQNPQMNMAQNPQMNMANNPQVSLAQNPQMSMAQNPQINVGKNPQTNMAQNPQMNMGQNPQTNMAQNPQMNMGQNPQMNMSQNPQINLAQNTQINMTHNPQMNLAQNAYTQNVNHDHHFALNHPHIPKRVANQGPISSLAKTVRKPENKRKRALANEVNTKEVGPQQAINSKSYSSSRLSRNINTAHSSNGRQNNYPNSYDNSVRSSYSQNAENFSNDDLTSTDWYPTRHENMTGTDHTMRTVENSKKEKMNISTDSSIGDLVIDETIDVKATKQQYGIDDCSENKNVVKSYTSNSASNSGKSNNTNSSSVQRQNEKPKQTVGQKDKISSKTGLRKLILKKQRLKKTQQQNQVRELSAMTSQVTKPSIESKLPHPPVMTSHTYKIQKMTPEINQPMVMTSQQRSKEGARPESMQLEQHVDNFSDREEH